MEPGYKFFSNRACKYFPCHAQPGQDEFNCLFCYCPLYALDAICGGDFKYNDKGVKLCMDCHLPHIPEYYDLIISKLKQLNNGRYQEGMQINFDDKVK